MNELICESIGEAWISACEYIFDKGNAMKDEDKDIKELLHFILKIKSPSEKDEIILKYGNKGMIDWMHSNFFEQKNVPELKNGLSYGHRLFNYDGKNQVEWVIEKLKKKPEAKSVTIPMLMPNKDSGYIPCVSMLDFKIREGKLMIVAMCRSIDFGKKVYANMLELHRVQKMVADKVGVPTGELLMYVVSAHIYADEYKQMRGIIEDVRNS
ncbi:MAG: thymidylate synthase [Nanoarchaeota archaeon]|nr:hypothetical protein [Nanoarchaeota archaeon]MBU1031170.1 hypothetical protein [Nanoarchaeota archaeon]MBU1849669.1 hypothetical protein [Nanoarchaeota archaeon]